jgi:hypothetical protein
MEISSLQSICFKFVAENKVRIPTDSKFYASDPSDLEKFASGILGKKHKTTLTKHLIAYFNVSSYTTLNLKHWKITSSILNLLGKNLTKLSLPALLSENEALIELLTRNPNLEVLELEETQLPSNFIECCKNLEKLKVLKLKKCWDLGYSTLVELKKIEVLELQGVELTDAFIKCCKNLKNLRVLKLKQCSGVGYSHLLDLFSHEASTSITELALPPLDLNDECFPKLLKNCGKQLENLFIEHEEKGEELVKDINGIRFKKTIFENFKAIITLKNLYDIGLHCPNLKSATFVNIRFHTNGFLGKPAGTTKSNYANLWESIFRSLTKLNWVKIKNDKRPTYDDSLSFLETMKLLRCKKLILEKFLMKEGSQEAIKENNSHVDIDFRDCVIKKPKTAIGG